MIQRYAPQICAVDVLEGIATAGTSRFVVLTPQCYLCPNNPRAAGGLNPSYESTFVFVNDYSAVKEYQQHYVADNDGDGRPSACFSPSPLLQVSAVLIHIFRKALLPAPGRVGQRKMLSHLLQPQAQPVCHQSVVNTPH